MDSTPVGWWDTVSSLRTRLVNTAAEWRCSTGRPHSFRLRRYISLAPTLSDFRWRRESGGGTSLDVTLPPTTPRRLRLSLQHLYRTPGDPNFWWRGNLILILHSHRGRIKTSILRQIWRRQDWKKCWCPSFSDDAHGINTGLCGVWSFWVGRCGPGWTIS